MISPVTIAAATKDTFAIILYALTPILPTIFSNFKLNINITIPDDISTIKLGKPLNSILDISFTLILNFINLKLHFLDIK